MPEPRKNSDSYFCVNTKGQKNEPQRWQLSNFYPLPLRIQPKGEVIQKIALLLPGHTMYPAHREQPGLTAGTSSHTEAAVPGGILLQSSEPLLPGRIRAAAPGKQSVTSTTSTVGWNLQFRVTNACRPSSHSSRLKHLHLVKTVAYHDKENPNLPDCVHVL